MFKEFKAVKQIPGEHRRRWFTAGLSELVVWYEDDSSIYGFQMTYKQRYRTYAVTWTTDKPILAHNEVDTGSTPPFGKLIHKKSAILIKDGPTPAEIVRQHLEDNRSGLDDQIYQTINDVVE